MFTKFSIKFRIPKLPKNYLHENLNFLNFLYQNYQLVVGISYQNEIKNLFYNILVLNGYPGPRYPPFKLAGTQIPLPSAMGISSLYTTIEVSFQNKCYIWSSPKNMSTKNRQLNRLNIQPCLKAAEPSSAAHIILLLVWSGSGNKGNSRLGWLADCPDIIRFLSGVKINGWGSILTTPFYLLSDCDSEQQLKVCWI